MYTFYVFVICLKEIRSVESSWMIYHDHIMDSALSKYLVEQCNI